MLAYSTCVQYIRQPQGVPRSARKAGVLPGIRSCPSAMWCAEQCCAQAQLVHAEYSRRPSQSGPWSPPARQKARQWSAPCWPHCGRPARSCSGKAHKGSVDLGFLGPQDRTILVRVATLAPDHPMLCSRRSAAPPGRLSSRASLCRLGLGGCQALSVSRCGQLRWLLKPSGSARP